MNLEPERQSTADLGRQGAEQGTEQMVNDGEDEEEQIPLLEKIECLLFFGDFDLEDENDTAVIPRMNNEIEERLVPDDKEVVFKSGISAAGGGGGEGEDGGEEKKFVAKDYDWEAMQRNIEKQKELNKQSHANLTKEKYQSIRKEIVAQQTKKREYYRKLFRDIYSVDAQQHEIAALLVDIATNVELMESEEFWISTIFAIRALVPLLPYCDKHQIHRLIRMNLFVFESDMDWYRLEEVFSCWLPSEIPHVFQCVFESVIDQTYTSSYPYATELVKDMLSRFYPLNPNFHDKIYQTGIIYLRAALKKQCKMLRPDLLIDNGPTVDDDICGMLCSALAGLKVITAASDIRRAACAELINGSNCNYLDILSDLDLPILSSDRAVIDSYKNVSAFFHNDEDEEEVQKALRRMQEKHKIKIQQKIQESRRKERKKLKKLGKETIEQQRRQRVMKEIEENRKIALINDDFETFAKGMRLLKYLPTRPCGLCKKQLIERKRSQCSRCRKTYCNAECQNGDWKRHKKECAKKPATCK